ncbi:aspartic peptidase domain-containing protein [Mycena haematopus]|nr:aspartic peptidase domain-containing protein [Mycena haematopus]
MFSRNSTLISGNPGETTLLSRSGRQGFYEQGATRNAGETQIINYGDSSIVDVDLYTGPLYLCAGLNADESAYHVCRSPNFIFGVATRATHHFKSRKIDGILGLGLCKTSKLQHFIVSLHEEELIEVGVSLLTIHGLQLPWGEYPKCLRKSFLVIGDNTGTVFQLDGAWSGWNSVVESSSHWIIRLETLVIADQTYTVGLNAIIDSGTTYSYFPENICQALDTALGGAQQELGSSNVLYRREQPIQTVRFDFGSTAMAYPLAMLLDPRPNTTSNAHGEACAYPAFKTANTLTLKGALKKKYCVLGNFFLRGLVAEFEHIRHGQGGRVRFASRKWSA